MSYQGKRKKETIFTRAAARREAKRSSTLKVALKRVAVANLICATSFVVSFSVMNQLDSELVLELINPVTGSAEGQHKVQETEADRQFAKASQLIEDNDCWRGDEDPGIVPGRVVYSDAEGKTKMGGEAQVARALNFLFAGAEEPSPKYEPYAFCR